MIDLEALRRVGEKFECQIEVVNIGTSGSERYMAIVKCPHGDYRKIAEFEKEIRSMCPEIDRTVLDITSPGR